MSQLVCSVCWNLIEVGSDAREGMDVLTRQDQTEIEEKFPTSMSLYRLLAEEVVQTTSGLKI